MDYTFSKAMECLPFSGIRVMMEEATRLEQSGREIIHLELGRPDFITPQRIRDACWESLEQGDVFYTSNYGKPQLRQAIAEKLLRDNGIPYQAEEILVTTGLSEAIYCSCAALLDSGDEILIPDPGWLNYNHVPRFFGAVPIPYCLRAQEDFQIDLRELERSLTPRTKAIVLISPHNPTGSVLQESTLKAIAEFAIRNNLYVFSDEIYEKIIFDEDSPHISIAALPGMKERTLTFNGFSKAYSMTGWRLGYVAADKKLISGIVRAHQYITTCAASFAQQAAITALKECEPDVQNMVREFKLRRDFIVKAVNRMPLVSCNKPNGAFYLFIDIRGMGMDSRCAADYFLQKAGVAMVPGSCFGANGEGYLRLSYSNSMEALNKATQRMHDTLDEFEKQMLQKNGGAAEITK